MEDAEAPDPLDVPTAAAVVGAPLALLAWLAVCHRRPEALYEALGLGPTVLEDWTSFFYPMGARVLDDPTPLDGFLYSPTAALLFAALAWMPYPVASFVWAAVLLASTLVLALAPRWILPGAPRRVWLTAYALTLWSYPALHTLKFGQVSTPLCAAAVVGFGLYCKPGPDPRGRRLHASALLLATAIAVKFYAARLALVPLFRRDWRAVAWIVGLSVAGLVVVPVAVLGPGPTVAFYAAVAAEIEQRFGDGVHNYNSQGAEAVLRRWGLRPIAAAARWAGCAVLAGWAFALIRGGDPRGALHGFVVLLASTPFLVPTAWPHYFVYLPFCQAVVWAELASGGAGRRSARVLAHAATGGSAALASMPAFDLLGDRHLFVRLGLLFLANLLVLVGLAAARHPARPRATEPGA